MYIAHPLNLSSFILNGPSKINCKMAQLPPVVGQVDHRYWGIIS